MNKIYHIEHIFLKKLDCFLLHRKGVRLDSMNVENIELGSIIYDQDTGKDYILSYDLNTQQRVWIPYSNEDDIDDVTVFILPSLPSTWDKYNFKEFLEIILDDLELSHEDIDPDMKHIILDMYHQYLSTNKMYYGSKSI
jgi:hypothetical protein